MFKSVYEFTKGFSLLFLLTGIFFLFKEMYIIGCIAVFSFFLIKFIDSDWAFDNFKFSNHNLVVIFVTFGLIFVNLFAIYQEMRFSPIFTSVTQEDKTSYMIYEDALFSAVSPCISAHNALVDRMNSNIPIYDADIKQANGYCYSVIMNIEKQVIPSNFNNELKTLCVRLKENFKRIAVNLATYNYSNEISQQGAILKIKENLNESINNMLKIREIMHLTEEVGEDKRAFIKL